MTEKISSGEWVVAIWGKGRLPENVEAEEMAKRIAKDLGIITFKGAGFYTGNPAAEIKRALADPEMVGNMTATKDEFMGFFESVDVSRSQSGKLWNHLAHRSFLREFGDSPSLPDYAIVEAAGARNYNFWVKFYGMSAESLMDYDELIIDKRSLKEQVDYLDRQIEIFGTDRVLPGLTGRDFGPKMFERCKAIVEHWFPPSSETGEVTL